MYIVTETGSTQCHGRHPVANGGTEQLYAERLALYNHYSALHRKEHIFLSSLILSYLDSLLAGVFTVS